MKKPAEDSPSDRGRALFLTPECPYPLESGGALRSASVFEYLTGKYDVDVIVFRQPEAADPATLFPTSRARNIHVIGLPHHHRNPVARAARNASRLLRRMPPLLDRFSGFGRQVAACVHGRSYDVAVIEHFWCAPYVEQLAPVAGRTVLDLHNIESQLHARCARTERGPAAIAHRGFEPACLDLERRWLPRFDLLLTASEQDARRTCEISPGARIQVFPNAIPYIEQPKGPERDMIAFSGNFDYHPNIAAVRFFVAQVWPGLRAQWPDLVWRLIGKNSNGVKNLVDTDRQIELSGPVDNAVAELSAAKVVVVPLLAGSGTRFKIIEAWAAGRAVVSTRIGAEGLPANHGENILLADEPADFAAAVSRLLSSSEERARLGKAGRALFESQFTWAAAWDRLDL